MNRILLLIIMLGTISAGYAEETKFYISFRTIPEKGDDDDKLSLFAIHLGGEINIKIDEFLPCATHMDQNDLAAVLDNERQKQLLGVGDDEALNSIAGSVGAQYLISITLIDMGSQISINTKCIDMKKAQPIVNIADQAPDDEGAFDVINVMADKFIDELCKYEICPYIGTLKVEVSEDLDVDRKSEYPVFCNGRDGLYKMSYKESKHTDNFWTFQKVTRVRADAFIDFDISEETDKVIDDDCHTCPQGKTRRYFHETVTKKGKITEVSEESEVYGQRINDARVEITFSEDGTYTIKIEATSAETEITETRYTNAESWCDTNGGPPKTITNKVDVPLTYIFGPFKGTAKDEFLTANPDPVEETNPISGLKTTYTISFDLQKE
jgi:hypothetical protein